ncbi:transposase [Saccharibacter sp. 17.LH.SD]|uniref:transposase n=1 Tax=Saccharibacter sp. 17.LH.SD TaxID=2689393 RepID=UPI00136F5F10|nr:transposase [Saccharibacter sp. 17.LH.SD]
MASDGHRKALAFTLSPGQAHELPQARVLLDQLPRLPTYLLCDGGYASYKFRKMLQQHKCTPVIPPKRRQFPFYCPQ